MYCCYRKSRKMRYTTAFVWLICGIGLFIGTLAYLLYYVPHRDDTYRDEINALIEDKEAEGLEDEVNELIKEKGAELLGRKMWEVWGWVRLFMQTSNDIWLISSLFGYAMELPPPAKNMAGINQQAPAAAKGGDVEMAPV